MTSDGDAARATPRGDGMGQSVVRTLLVDDHEFFRSGLRRLLTQQTGIEVIGDAPDGAAAIDLYERRRPDVVVMDLRMPVLSGVEATERLMASWPDAHVLVLTVSSDDATVIDAIRAGACGYVVKDAPLEEITRAIHAVASGQLLVSPRVTHALVEAAEDTAERVEKVTTVTSSLSERERQILQLIAEGKGNSEIAADLYLSPSTVKNRVARVLEKLGVENRVEAAVYAVRAGLA